jgi:ABC-type transporter Mla subunit MlaD
MDDALSRANERLAAAAAKRSTPADVDAALERARAAVDSLTQVSARLQEGLPAAIQEGLREHFRPSARHLAEVRGLMNQVLRRLEHLEGDLLAERHARVGDLALLVDLIANGWESVNERLARIEDALEQRRLRSVS